MHSLESLNLDRCQETTSLGASEDRLEFGGTFLGSNILASVDLHSVVIGEKHRRGCLSQFVPSERKGTKVRDGEKDSGATECKPEEHTESDPCIHGSIFVPCQPRLKECRIASSS